MEPISLRDLADATEGVLLPAGAGSRTVRSVSTDSRTIESGECFWAIRGPRFDGHAFVEEAVRKGAAAVVVDDASQGLPEIPTVAVADTTAAFGRFAQWYRRLMDAVFVGVTGSAGKTTTRELLSAVLQSRGPGKQTEQNFNNFYGVSRTILSVEHGDAFAVVELATSEFGEIARLAEICEPDVGVVTAIGEAHLRGLKTIAQVAGEKGDLLRQLPRQGFAVVPREARHFARLIDRTNCPVLRVGTDPGSDVVWSIAAFDGERLSVDVDGTLFEVAAAGPHFAPNVASTVTVARRLGLTAKEIQLGLDTFRPLAGRGRIVRETPWVVVDDSFNANPLSVQAAATALAARPCSGRRILVLGQMLDLGDEAPAAHQRTGREIGRSGIDRLFGYGEHAGHLAHGWREAGRDARCSAVFETAAEVCRMLRKELEPGDAVWVKGSRSMRAERVVEFLDAWGNEFAPVEEVPALRTAA